MPQSSASRKSCRTCSGSGSIVPTDDHAITFDLLKRAEATGAHVLVPTIDSAGKSKRLRDIKNGVRVPFTIGLRIFLQIASSPFWALAPYKAGRPRTENLVSYVAERATRDPTAKVMVLRGSGSHTYDESR